LRGSTVFTVFAITSTGSRASGCWSGLCVCWANENWTRRWDGLEHEILIGQTHSPEDDLAFIAHLEPALRDPRYIRIHERPLLIVYRPQLFPHPSATAALWRQYARDRGFAEPYLVNVRSFPEAVDPETIGFDAAVEFPPHQYPWTEITPQATPLNKKYSGKILDYRVCVAEAET
jgi:lipopolysaccharide biosynthesis protein